MPINSHISLSRTTMRRCNQLLQLIQQVCFTKENSQTREKYLLRSSPGSFSASRPEIQVSYTYMYIYAYILLHAYIWSIFVTIWLFFLKGILKANILCALSREVTQHFILLNPTEMLSWNS